MKITLYIGSNENGIDKPYLEKVHTVLKKHFRGYTIQQSIGFWEGTQEESVEIIIFVQNLIIGDLEACIDELKQVLGQERIIYTVELIEWNPR